jgi:hypothetical protein
VRLGKTEEGLPACIVPVNQQESQHAMEQLPIDTTVCEIVEHPSAFNNRMVRIRGNASGNFEYSELGEDGCSGALWFSYGGEGGPPGLLAHVGGAAMPGSEDADGRYILPVPVRLIRGSNFQRFERLMKTRAEADERSERDDPNHFVQHRVSATFVGRIDGVPDDIHRFHLERGEHQQSDFLGFGMMGLFDAQFVMGSVEGDAVLETDPPASVSVAGASR